MRARVREQITVTENSNMTNKIVIVKCHVYLQIANI